MNYVDQLRQATTLANTFGHCFLDGQPARLVPGPAVETLDGARKLRVNPAAVVTCVLEQGGQFKTPEATKAARATHKVMAREEKRETQAREVRRQFSAFSLYV